MRPGGSSGFFEQDELALFSFGDLVFIGLDHAGIRRLNNSVDQLANLRLASFSFTPESVCPLLSTRKALVPTIGQHGSRHLDQCPCRLKLTQQVSKLTL
ncbi:hypothetical protein D1223_13670 [Henriciella mobilis]|uniref:Uncharacterized protein n=1 Tax=Henriciella mobilis TaxID=2305467 RepID=A0A399RFP2_9PROT|nr:hypothetical protein D1223_13670 [Henriciella mobilis]